jgi:asparagine synthase (glutamine-hydrolysing)
MSRLLYLETMVWLVDDPLAKVDKMTMAASLEARVPFLDPRLVELAATIPSELKYKKGVSKYILRRAMKDVLPDEIFNRPKHGFDVPIEHWLRKELKPLLKVLLSEKELNRTEVFNYDKIQRILSDHNSGKHDLSSEIWSILNFQIWHKIYIQGERWQKISALL